MRKLVVILLFLSSAILLQLCKPYQPEGQGITGTVTWIEGNQMPTINDNADTGSKSASKPIKRTLRVYPLIQFEDLKVENGLYTAVAEQPLTEVETDEKGKYSIQLSPGRYSILVVEEDGLFASIFDGEGNVQPVTVKENEWTLLDIEVNYKAAY